VQALLAQAGGACIPAISHSFRTLRVLRNLRIGSFALNHLVSAVVFGYVHGVVGALNKRVDVVVIA